MRGESPSLDILLCGLCQHGWTTFDLDTRDTSAISDHSKSNCSVYVAMLGNSRIEGHTRAENFGQVTLLPRTDQWRHHQDRQHKRNGYSETIVVAFAHFGLPMKSLATSKRET